ncbi:hypothetical protein SAMN04487969_102520 [Paenibacillus algorifonticola]|uniref:Uncharacterized protein n=1 Tax=Paenibacillus algorifonticola TaxID=684063 RepID=A0A1I2AJC6_9BACL|nr:hypothetical protein [Paenibacillus algorifonticola]SFE43889.1 hypothetical protein SAMN04487969_102520 [Paenibacillus algorifonticola]
MRGNLALTEAAGDDSLVMGCIRLSGSIALTLCLRGDTTVAEKNQNFSMFAGESKKVIVSVTGCGGTPANIEGSNVQWVLKENRWTVGNLVDKELNNGIEVSDNTPGQFTLFLEPEDTEGLSGLYYHAAEITDLSGNISTVFVGYITITEDGVRI